MEEAVDFVRAESSTLATLVADDPAATWRDVIPPDVPEDVFLDRVRLIKQVAEHVIDPEAVFSIWVSPFAFLLPMLARVDPTPLVHVADYLQLPPRLTVRLRLNRLVAAWQRAGVCAGTLVLEDGRWMLRDCDAPPELCAFLQETISARFATEERVGALAWGFETQSHTDIWVAQPWRPSRSLFLGLFGWAETDTRTAWRAGRCFGGHKGSSASKRELVVVVDMLLGRFNWSSLSGSGAISTLSSRELAGAVAIADASVIQRLRDTSPVFPDYWEDPTVELAAGKRGDIAVVDAVVGPRAAGRLSWATKGICRAAAAAGHEHVLAHVYTAANELDSYRAPRDLLEAAARGGHVHVLDWVCANMCKLTRRARPGDQVPSDLKGVASIAAHYCHIDVLEWAFAQGVLASPVRDWLYGVPPERKARTCEWLEAHWLVPDTVDNAWSYPLS